MSTISMFNSRLLSTPHCHILLHLPCSPVPHLPLCLPHVPHIPHLLSHLVSEVMKLKKPTAMVLFNGGAMSLGPLKDSLSAIVAANYGGEMGAIALADVLFGHHNPTAKLAATW